MRRSGHHTGETCEHRPCLGTESTMRRTSYGDRRYRVGPRQSTKEAAGESSGQLCCGSTTVSLARRRRIAIRAPWAHGLSTGYAHRFRRVLPRLWRGLQRDHDLGAVLNALRAPAGWGAERLSGGGLSPVLGLLRARVHGFRSRSWFKGARVVTVSLRVSEPVNPPGNEAPTNRAPAPAQTSTPRNRITVGYVHQDRHPARTAPDRRCAGAAPERGASAQNQDGSPTVGAAAASANRFGTAPASTRTFTGTEHPRPPVRRSRSFRAAATRSRTTASACARQRLRTARSGTTCTSSTDVPRIEARAQAAFAAATDGSTTDRLPQTGPTPDSRRVGRGGDHSAGATSPTRRAEQHPLVSIPTRAVTLLTSLRPPTTTTWLHPVHVEDGVHGAARDAWRWESIRPRATRRDESAAPRPFRAQSDPAVGRWH